jgi:predicted metalloprotease with PDZ domain
VTHNPTDRVHLHWSLTPSASGPQASAVQLNPRWFAAAGHSVLPVPQELDEANPPQACIRLAAPESNPIAPMRWASSHGVAEGNNTVLRPAAGLATLRSRVQQALYAGGALSLATLQAEGQSVNVVTPDGVAWPFSLDALAQKSAKAVGVQRRFWGDTTATRAPLLVLMLPGVPGQTQAQGSAWYQAVALQAPLDLAVPSASFDALITPALVRTWVPDRIGPVQLLGRDDAALRAWFSEGFADYLAHRSLLREGSWTSDDYAAAVGRKLDTLTQSPFRQTDNTTLARRWPNDPDQADLPAARGELLALRWHNSLRAAGHAGLDAVLRRLLVPAAQARHDGPLSAPLATHRLVAGLRQEMGDTPLRDITRLIEQGEAFGPEATNLGPCLESVPNPVAGQARHRAVAQASTQAACQGWLGLGPLANGSGPRSAAKATDDASPAGKVSSHGKGKGKKTSKTKGKASAKPTTKASASARSKKAH